MHARHSNCFAWLRVWIFAQSLLTLAASLYLATADWKVWLCAVGAQFLLTASLGEGVSPEFGFASALPYVVCSGSVVIAFVMTASSFQVTLLLAVAFFAEVALSQHIEGT